MAVIVSRISGSWPTDRESQQYYAISPCIPLGFLLKLKGLNQQKVVHLANLRASKLVEKWWSCAPYVPPMGKGVSILAHACQRLQPQRRAAHHSI
jgi:hypothetical protein